MAIDIRFRTPRLELKCLGTSFGGENKGFQSHETKHGRLVIKAHDTTAQRGGVLSTNFVHFPLFFVTTPHCFMKCDGHFTSNPVNVVAKRKLNIKI